MSRKILFLRPEAKKSCVTSSPCQRRTLDSEAALSTMVLSETRGLWLSWVIRGGIGLSQRLSARGTGLQSIGILTLEPERLRNRVATTRIKCSGDGRGSSWRRSSGLRFQFFCVEVFSFFPKG